MNNIIDKIEAIIAEAERCKTAYFWTPAGNAAGRRRNEERHGKDRIEWTDGENVYSAEYIYRETCRNVYAYGSYTRNGSKTTLTAIKNSLKRLKTAEAANA